MSILVEGKKAPAFSLENQIGEKVTLSKISSDYTVLFFYPKDNTSGCTVEAQGFEKLQKKFTALGVTLIGISGGDQKSKQTFCKKHNLTITLLSDPDGTTGSKYGVYGNKKFMGRTYKGFNRVSFVLDASKKIIKVFEKVKPPTHPNEVLEFIKGL